MIPPPNSLDIFSDAEEEAVSERRRRKDKKLKKKQFPFQPSKKEQRSQGKEVAPPDFYIQREKELGLRKSE